MFAQRISQGRAFTRITSLLNTKKYGKEKESSKEDGEEKLEAPKIVFGASPEHLRNVEHISRSAFFLARWRSFGL
jgi:hypothetical protein